MERNYAQKYSILERTGYLDLMQFQLQSSQKKQLAKHFYRKAKDLCKFDLIDGSYTSHHWLCYGS